MSDDSYHDDPVEVDKTKKFRSKFATSAVVIFASILFFQSTFAGNISLSSGAGIEFGQGVSQATACSGSTNLTVTPYSSFKNEIGTGKHYLNSIKVSNIPTSCYGVDFSINAYDDSSNTPLAIMNTTYNGVVVYNNGGTFTSSYGTTISSGSGTFTVTITNPIALASSVYKLVIQSSAHTTWSCAQGGACSVGDFGPGGGTVFYASAGFSCGADYSQTCKYLEAAPATWYPGTTDYPVDNSAPSYPLNNWASTATNCYDTTSDSAPRIACNYSGSLYNAATRAAAGVNGIDGNFLIGMGLKNTNLIVSFSSAYDASTNSYAAGAARAYNGGYKADWFMPSFSELNQLCKYVRGQSWVSDATLCSAASATPNLLGIVNMHYYSSSEIVWTNDAPFTREKGVFINHNENNTGVVDSGRKNGDSNTRPVRAF
jgi:hypothetical protein